MKATQDTAVKKQDLTATQKLELVMTQLSELTNGFNSLVEANQTLTLQLASLALSLNGEIKRNNTLRAELGAITNLVEAGQPVSRENIQEQVIAAKVAYLKEELEKLIAQGLLEPTEEVQADSLIVAQQQTREGKIIDQRLQVAMASLSSELQMKILSKKAGETIDLGEDEPLLYLLEVYKDVSDKAESPKEA